ncbi:MAG TPA: PspC domain-containing protein [Bacteroidota bacterium]|nr:PspC domain-containing protein [Bacteroidota bacterium]
MPEQAKRLYRSRKHKMLGGVCGGIAEYLGVDPTIVRVAWIVISLFPLIPGILVYIIAWIVIPKEPGAESPSTVPISPPGTTAAFFGFFFIAFGTLLLLSNLDIFDWDRWWHISWEYAVPLLLIATGVFFLVRPSIQKATEPSPEGAANAAPEQAPDRKRLRRSSTDRKLYGVCGGLAEYFNVDPSLIRVGFVFFSLWPAGLGVLAYVLLLLVMPEGQSRPQTQS